MFFIKTHWTCSETSRGKHSVNTNIEHLHSGYPIKFGLSDATVVTHFQFENILSFISKFGCLAFYFHCLPIPSCQSEKQNTQILNLNSFLFMIFKMEVFFPQFYKFMWPNDAKKNVYAKCACVASCRHR